jgi:2-oxoglutarate dehydrogenase E2 component (dihydrolipoamide succinyltransferase)
VSRSQRGVEANSETNMAIRVEVPALGESIKSAILVAWHKADGQAVDVDEPLCELETDKANVDVSAPAAGVLRHLRGEGDTVAVGEEIARSDVWGARPGMGGGQAGEMSAAGGSQAGGQRGYHAGANAGPRPDPLPEYREREIGGRSAEDRERAELAHDPAKARTPEPQRPGPRDVTQSGMIEPVGQPIAQTAEQASQSGAPQAGETGVPQASETGATRAAERAGDATQAGAAPLEVPPGPKPPASTVAPKGPAAAAITFDASGVRRVPMSRIRQRIAQTLVEAQRTAAILTTFNEIDMSAVSELRARYKEKFEEAHGVGLGLMSFFARAVVQAARELPRLNAFIDGTDIVYHNYLHLGIAVSTDRGLAVPVLRNVQEMGFARIEAQIKRLAGATREGKLSIEELSGATFTITNGGVFGSLLSTPILTPPQSGILGLHAIQKRPVAVGDRVEIRPMMYVALSYDHRLVDGREAITFLVRIKQLVEEPARLMLEV